jgi:hypothetical protein
MNEAWFVILGVVIGALIPAAERFFASLQQSHAASEDRQEGRDARLFDDRRQAYRSFISEAADALDWLWRSEDEPGSVPEPDEGLLDRLRAKETDGHPLRRSKHRRQGAGHSRQHQGLLARTEGRSLQGGCGRHSGFRRGSPTRPWCAEVTFTDGSGTAAKDKSRERGSMFRIEALAHMFRAV